jgi:hypothetical protein
VNKHHLWSVLPYQVGKRADHPWLGEDRVECPLRDDIETPECSAPAGNLMHRKVTVHPGAGAL